MDEDDDRRARSTCNWKNSNWAGKNERGDDDVQKFREASPPPDSIKEEEGFIDYEAWIKAKGSWWWESPSVDRPCNPTLRATVGLGAMMRQLQATTAAPSTATTRARGGVTTSLSAVLAMTAQPQQRKATKSKASQEREWTDGRTGDLVLSRLPADVRLNGRFRPVRMIGEGTFAQLLDAIDEWRTPPSSYSATTDGKLHVAIKIMKAPFSDPDALHVHSSIGIQEATWIRQLNRVDANNMSHTIRLHSTFYFGGHLCLVLELLGEPLSSAPPPHPLCFLSPSVTAPSSSSSSSFPLPSSTSASSSSSSSSTASPSSASRRSSSPAPSPAAARTYTLPEIRSIAVQLLTSLSFLRNRGILHADIKPENIALVPPPSAMCHGLSLHDHSANYFPIHTLPNIKLIDFGNAIPLALNTEYNKVQSLPYRAPEVLWGEPYDTAIDMWSVGCVLYELATGDLLFPLPSAQDDRADPDELEHSLRREMTALLGGEAEALCDGWTPSERKQRTREWHAERRLRRRRRQRRTQRTDDHPSPPTERRRRSRNSVDSDDVDTEHSGRRRRTKVLFWDETVGGGRSRGQAADMAVDDNDEGDEADEMKTTTAAASDDGRVFLSYRKGDRLHIFGRKGESYWRCWRRGKEGLVPVAHLRLLTPFRCASTEDSESESEIKSESESESGGKNESDEAYSPSELKWMRAKERERAIRHKQVDITLRRLVKQMRTNDFIFADFLTQFLIYDPKRRYTPQEALFHRFLVPFFPFKGVFPELNDAKLVPSAEALREEAAELVAVKVELDQQERTESRLSPNKARQREHQHDAASAAMEIEVRERHLAERERAADAARRRADQQCAQLEEEKRQIEARREQVDKDQVLVDSARRGIFTERERLRMEKRGLESLRKANEAEGRRLAEALATLEVERQGVQEQRVRLAQEGESLARERARVDSARSQVKEREARLAAAKSEVEKSESENEAERARLADAQGELERNMAAFDDELRTERDRIQRESDEVERAQVQLEAARQRLDEKRDKLVKERTAINQAWAVIKDKEGLLAELTAQAEKSESENEAERARLAELQAELERDRAAFDEERRVERERLRAESEKAERRRTRLASEAARIAKRKNEADERERANDDERVRLDQARAELEQSRAAFETEQRAERERLEAEREEVAQAERKLMAAEGARVTRERIEAEATRTEIAAEQARLARTKTEVEKSERENEDERARLARERSELEAERRDFDQRQHDAREQAERDRAELDAARQRHSDEVAQWKAASVAHPRRRQQQLTGSGDGHQQPLALLHQSEGQTSSPLSPSSPWSSPSPALIHRHHHQSHRQSPLAALVTPSGRFVPVASASTLRPFTSTAVATSSSASASSSRTSSPSVSPRPAHALLRASTPVAAPASASTVPTDLGDDDDDILLIEGERSVDDGAKRKASASGRASAAQQARKRRRRVDSALGAGAEEAGLTEDGQSGEEQEDSVSDLEKPRSQANNEGNDNENGGSGGGGDGGGEGDEEEEPAVPSPKRSGRRKPAARRRRPPITRAQNPAPART